MGQVKLACMDREVNIKMNLLEGGDLNEKVADLSQEMAHLQKASDRLYSPLTLRAMEMELSLIREKQRFERSYQSVEKQVRQPVEQDENRRRRREIADAQRHQNIQTRMDRGEVPVGVSAPNSLLRDLRREFTQIKDRDQESIEMSNLRHPHEQDRQRAAIGTMKFDTGSPEWHERVRDELQTVRLQAEYDTEHKKAMIPYNLDQARMRMASDFEVGAAAIPYRSQERREQQANDSRLAQMEVPYRAKERQEHEASEFRLMQMRKPSEIQTQGMMIGMRRQELRTPQAFANIQEEDRNQINAERLQKEEGFLRSLAANQRKYGDILGGTKTVMGEIAQATAPVLTSFIMMKASILGFAAVNDGGAFMTFMKRLELFGGAIGGIVDPVLEKWADRLEDWAKKIDALPEGTKRFIATLAELAFSIGTATLLVKGLAFVFGPLGTGLRMLSSVPGVISAGAGALFGRTAATVAAGTIGSFSGATGGFSAAGGLAGLATAGTVGATAAAARTMPVPVGSPVGSSLAAAAATGVTAAAARSAPAPVPAALAAAANAGAIGTVVAGGSPRPVAVTRPAAPVPAASPSPVASAASAAGVGLGARAAGLAGRLAWPLAIAYGMYEIAAGNTGGVNEMTPDVNAERTPRQGQLERAIEMGDRQERISGTQSWYQGSGQARYQNVIDVLIRQGLTREEAERRLAPHSDWAVGGRAIRGSNALFGGDSATTPEGRTALAQQLASPTAAQAERNRGRSIGFQSMQMGIYDLHDYVQRESLREQPDQDLFEQRMERARRVWERDGDGEGGGGPISEAVTAVFNAGFDRVVETIRGLANALGFGGS